jgi:hypothetical protein
LMTPSSTKMSALKVLSAFTIFPPLIRRDIALEVLEMLENKKSHERSVKTCQLSSIRSIHMEKDDNTIVSLAFTGIVVKRDKKTNSNYFVRLVHE